jgi:hypothetical protein
VAALRGAEKRPRSPGFAGLACIDPRAAVALLDSMTPPPAFARYNPYHDARFWLAKILGLPREERWKWLSRWNAVQIPLDE